MSSNFQKILKKKWDELPSKPLKLGAYFFILWLGIHLFYAKTFLFHDGIRHILPVVYGLVKQGNIFGLPHWLGSTDSGSPTLIYVMSMSLTIPVRIVAMSIMSILKLKFLTALYFQKFEILTTMLAIALGMYVLGRVLFKKHLSAIYLFVITLFSGMCIQGLHSDQVLSEMFYLPWVAACGVLFHRNRISQKGFFYLNGVVLFLSLATFDLHPHYPVFLTLLGGLIYILIYPETLRLFLKPKSFLKLTPALLILIVTVVQLWIVKSNFDNYVTALRSRGEVTVKLSDFGESNFIQPTALLGTFWPMGFFRGYEAFKQSVSNMLTSAFHVSGREMFLYKHDQALMIFGWVPLIFFMAFILRPGFQRQRFFWGGFTILFFLATFQDTHLYNLFFHLPFFNLFRTYGLLIVQATFGFLIMSGYGMDAYLTLESEARKKMIFRSLAIVGGLSILTGTVLIVLMTFYKSNVAFQQNKVIRDLLTDLIITGVGGFAVWKSALSKKPSQAAIGLMAVASLSQIAVFDMAYKMFGNGSHIVQRYQLEIGDWDFIKKHVEDPYVDELSYKAGIKRPVVPHRIGCDTYALCYIANQDGMSTWSPTFLVNKEEPFYRFLPDTWPPWRSTGSPYKIKLKKESYEAVSGITHPIFWLSNRIIPFQEKDEITLTLNKQPEPRSFLDNAIFVPQDEAKLLERTPTNPKGQHEITAFKKGADRYELTYKSDSPVYLAAAINYDPFWRATVNGQRLPVYKANYNGMIAQLPPGQNTLEFEYVSWQSRFFFWFRYLFVAAGLYVMWMITKSMRRRI